MKNQPQNQYLDPKGHYRFKHNKRLVHRSVYEQRHGFIPRDWVVHHLNGNKKNNKLWNLIGLHEDFHRKLHKHWPIHQLPSRAKIYKILKNKYWVWKDHKEVKKQRELEKKEAKRFIPVVLTRKNNGTETRSIASNRSTLQ